jgi:calcium/calmodulin-dependent protein kinase I
MEQSLLFALQIARGMKHATEQIPGFVHRDLKPENILLAYPGEDSPVKIADYGFAKPEGGERLLETACGTPGYVAPEILKGGTYGKEVDIWSLGVITFILLCGYPPFHHENQTILFRLIKRGKFEFDSPYWDNVSEGAKDLIRRMLVIDPTKRIKAPAIMEHPWIAGPITTDANLASAVQELKKFNARRKLKSAMAAVRAGVRIRMATAVLKPSPASKAAATAVAKRASVTADAGRV